MLSVNSTISYYRIISSIGAGGVGQVYLAEDTRLGRKVALKILPPEFASDRNRLPRFEQEAKAASALNHPNIITIHAFGQLNDVHFIVTEFIEGRTLRHRIGPERAELRGAGTCVRPRRAARRSGDPSSENEGALVTAIRIALLLCADSCRSGRSRTGV